MSPLPSGSPADLLHKGRYLSAQRFVCILGRSTRRLGQVERMIPTLNDEEAPRVGETGENRLEQFRFAERIAGPDEEDAWYLDPLRSA